MQTGGTCVFKHTDKAGKQTKVEDQLPEIRTKRMEFQLLNGGHTQTFSQRSILMKIGGPPNKETILIPMLSQCGKLPYSKEKRANARNYPARCLQGFASTVASTLRRAGTNGSVGTTQGFFFTKSRTEKTRIRSQNKDCYMSCLPDKNQL